MANGTFPKHVEIAVDIAEKIKQRELKVGAKLRGRSLVSSDYSVSSETIRKAFNLLQKYDVIEVKEKSGAFIMSRENAVAFLNNHRKKNNLEKEINTMRELYVKHREIEHQIKASLKKIEAFVKTTHEKLPIEYFTIQVHENFECVGKAIKDMDFHEQTGATLFGIVSDNGTISTLDPSYVLQTDDILYFSGNNDSVNKIIKLIKKS